MVRRIAKYEIVRELGQGAFGKVFLATNVTPDGKKQEVAIKMLSLRLISDQQMERQVKREVEILSSINHPHVVRLIEVLKTESHMFLVCEFIDGGDLFDRIISTERLGEADARHYFKQIAEAVEACHHKGIVHRDIKAENILLTSENSIKVADFGLSRMFETASTAELCNTFCGTANYSSSEIINSEAYDGRAVDSWSLGVLLYIMCSGQMPFDEESPSVLYDKIRRADYTMPAHFSAELQDLIRKIIVTNPKARLTVSAMLQHAWVQT